MEIEMYIERDEQEILVKVELEYEKACRGSRDSLCGVRGAGPALEPDYPENFDVIGATDDNGNEVELDSQETEKAIDKAFEYIENNSENF